MRIRNMEKVYPLDMDIPEKGRHSTIHPDNASDQILNQSTKHKSRNIWGKFNSTEIQTMSWQSPFDSYAGRPSIKLLDNQHFDQDRK